MYQVVVLNSQGERTVIDFHALTLDSGERAFGQEPSVLFRALAKMKVPGIAVDMGSHDLLIALGRYRAASPPAPVVHKRQPSTGDAA